MKRKVKTMASLPPVGLKVIAQCAGFRCMAYRDIDGKWMAAFDHRELKGIISFRLMTGSVSRADGNIVPLVPPGWATAV